MTSDRGLRWAGCDNVRDLGGLRTIDGRVTLSSALVRSDNPCKLTRGGWESLRAHGIGTIVSLRTDGAPEDDPRELDETSGLDVVTVAIEDLGDRDFVDRFVQTGIWGTPLYFADAVKRWPQRHVDAVRAVAHARKGGVLVHCGRGHDRTGIVIAILLHLVEVEADEIVADYELSVDAERDETLARLATTTSEALRAFLREPLFTLLGGAGLTREDCDLLRARLVAQ